MQLHKRYFSQEERQFIFDNYETLTTKQIAARIGRSQSSVKGFKAHNKLNSLAMRTKALRQANIRRLANQKLSLTIADKERRCLEGLPSKEKEKSILSEMQALIKLCELTDNKSIRLQAKIKLAQLSEIPKNNFYSLDNTIRRTQLKWKTSK